MPAGDGQYWYERGLETMVELGWTPEKSNVHPLQPAIDQAFWNHTIENLMGRIWSRPGLTLREREMVAIGNLVAVGSAPGLEIHLRFCHAVGLSELQVRQVIMVGGYYAGWCFMAASMLYFDQWLDAPDSNWPAEMRMELPARGEEPARDDTDYLEVGKQTAARLGLSSEDFDGFDPEFRDMTFENLWGRVYSQAGLSDRDRQIVVLAALLRTGDERAFKSHFALARAAGLSEHEVREVLLQAGYYSGWARYTSAVAYFEEFLAAEPTSAHDVDLRSASVS